MTDILLTVSSKGQITLPKKARDRLGVLAGSKLRLSMSAPDKLTLTKEPTVNDYYGKFPNLWNGQDPVKLTRTIRDSDRT